MFNEFLLGLNSAMETSNNSAMIIIGLILIIAEILFFINIKENNKSSRPKDSDFPVIRRSKFDSDIKFVLTCKLGYVFLSTFISMFIIAIIYFIGIIIYTLNMIYFMWFIAVVIFVMFNYFIYKQLKRKS